MAIQPTLALIPAAQGSKFYSVLPSNGVGDFDFSRASTATRVNSKGLIEEVASGVSRLDYTGGGCPHHLLEPQSTNLLQYSEDFSNSYWIKQDSSILSNQAISPDGTLNASLYTTSSATFDFIETTSSFIVSGYSFSVFAKKGTSDKIDLSLSGTAFTDTRSVRFDLTNKTSETLAGILRSNIEDYGNGWMRCSIYAVTNASGSGNVRLLSGSSDNVSTLYLWGAQLEQKSYASSNIPTNGSESTRLRDLSDTQNLSNVIGQTEGTIFYDAILVRKSINTSEYLYELTISDGSTQNIFVIDNYNNSLSIIMKNGGSIQFTNNSFNPTEGARYRLGFAYKQNDFALYINGNQIATDTSGTVPTMNQITFGNYYSNQTNLQNSVKVNDFKLYNTRLTNTELQALTQV